MKTYDIFLEYYDKIVRNINNPLEEEIEFLVEDCIKEYKPETKTILELACGTGIVANELIKVGYEVTGLDINERMLERAEENISKNNLVLGDMTNFDLKKKFDTILCNYNSICHLLKWEDWQRFFEMSYNHLEKDGLLIFDINTLFEFESITRDFAQFYTFGDDVVCLEMKKTSPPAPLLRGEGGQGGFVYEWLVKIFKKSSDGRFDLIDEVIRENSFEVENIKKELENTGFEVLETIDYHYGEVREESERVYFICRKK